MLKAILQLINNVLASYDEYRREQLKEKARQARERVSDDPSAGFNEHFSGGVQPTADGTREQVPGDKAPIDHHPV